MTKTFVAFQKYFIISVKEVNGKWLSTSNIDIVNYCRAEFNFELPGTVIEQRTSQFRDKYRTCDNLYCKLLCVR